MFPRQLQYFCMVVASALAGCSALTLSINYANCAAYGVVSIRSDTSSTYGTVCGTVSKATANYICNYFNYGTAVDFGTAASKGVAGGTGTIAGKNLVCVDTIGCTYNPSTSGCTHSKDLVVKCSHQRSPGAIVGIVIALLFLCFVIFVVPCICCCVCACMGVACFARISPSYNQL